MDVLFQIPLGEMLRLGGLLALGVAVLAVVAAMDW